MFSISKQATTILSKLEILVFCLFFYYFSWYASPRNCHLLSLRDTGTSLLWGILSFSVLYHRWKHIFPWCRGREAVIPKAKPGAWHLYLDWRLFSHFDALTTHPTALIFQTAGGSAMFLPPTTKSKTSQKSETQQPGAKSDSLKGIQSAPGKNYFLVRSKWTSFLEFSSIVYN